MSVMSRVSLSFFTAITLALPGSAALADPGHGKASAIGRPGKAAEATRTVTLVMRDNFYDALSITVRPGQTIRFVLKNEGELLHEFNIGTPPMHENHQAEMLKMMELGMLTPTSMNFDMDHAAMGHAPMKHDDPNSVLVEPGRTKELVWTFGAAQKLEFACNVPGHYHSGMVGSFKFGR